MKFLLFWLHVLMWALFGFYLGYQYAYYEMISAPPTYHTHTENRV